MIVNPWVIKVCLKTRDGKTVPVTYKGTGWVDTIFAECPRCGRPVTIIGLSSIFSGGEYIAHCICGEEIRIPVPDWNDMSKRMVHGKVVK